MSKKLTYWPVVGATAVALITLCVCAFGIHYAHRFNFAMFEPRTLPSGIVLKGHEASLYTGEGDETFKQLTYSTTSSDFSIWEVKSSPQDYRMRMFSCSTPLQYSPCINYSSPHGQVYSVQTVHFNASDAPSTEQTISWLRGNTLVWISLNGEQAHRYPPQEWGAIIDSFLPISYDKEPAKHYRWQGV